MNGQSQTTRAVLELREMLLEGDFQPGERLAALTPFSSPPLLP